MFPRLSAAPAGAPSLPTSSVPSDLPSKREPAPTLQLGDAELRLIPPDRWKRRDHDAEGHFVCPSRPGEPAVVAFDSLAKRPGYLDLLARDELSVAPRAQDPQAVGPSVTRVFIAGLNTPVPEAHRRAERYANVLELRFAELHNGTRSQEGGALCGLLEPKYKDWENAAVSRVTALRSTLGLLPSIQWRRNNARLVSNIETLVLDSLDAQRPLELCAYSDATILAGVAVERLYRGWASRHAGDGALASREEFARRLDENLTLVAIGSAWSNYRVRMRSRNPLRRLAEWCSGGRPSLYANVVELHAFGDPARGLGRDVLPTKLGPESTGRFFRKKADNLGAVTVRFPSPYPGFQNHNLALHLRAVKAILDANEAKSFRELHARGQAGTLVLPDERELVEGVLADYDACREERHFWGEEALPRPLLKTSKSDPSRWTVVQPPVEALAADEVCVRIERDGRAVEV